MAELLKVSKLMGKQYNFYELNLESSRDTFLKIIYCLCIHPDIQFRGLYACQSRAVEIIEKSGKAIDDFSREFKSFDDFLYFFNKNDFNSWTLYCNIYGIRCQVYNYSKEYNKIYIEYNENKLFSVGNILEDIEQFISKQKDRL